jgi:hypothetical protein
VEFHAKTGRVATATFGVTGGCSWSSHIPSPASLQHALNEVFSGLRDYTIRISKEFLQGFDNRQTNSDDSPELRLLCQLAPGVDQMAASTAVELGYALHIVLPASRVAFESDIQQQNLEGSMFGSEKEASQDSVWTCRDLLQQASRVLEMDPPVGPVSSRALTNDAYSQASTVILDHSDIVVVAVHENGTNHPGGTKWIEQRAEELNLPVVRIPIDRPSQAILIWTTEGRRETRFLFNAMSEGLNSSVFDSALNDNLLMQGATSNPYRSGWFEDRIVNQLDSVFNAKIWDQRWTLPNSSTALAEHSLGKVPAQIDRSLKDVKVWADHRASAMAEIVRGSFIVCSILGCVAVFAAVGGALFHDIGTIAKITEILCLLIVLCFMKRSAQRRWRSQWLSSRQLERAIEQASWLLMLGRTPSFVIPAHSLDFQANANTLWFNWYLRAVLRSAPFPTAQLDDDYIKTVHELALHNLVRNQISYFESESTLYHRTDEFLERFTNGCIVLAFLVTFAYLVGPYLSLLVHHIDALSKVGAALAAFPARVSVWAGPTAVIITILMPAVAATISAVRNHGEYAQIAARYSGISQSLRQIEYKLVHILPDARQTVPMQPLRSADLVALLLTATSALFQEVVGWQSILQRKKIEPN